MSYQATSALGQAVEAVIGLMNATHPFAAVTRGALPTGTGLTCEPAMGGLVELHMDKNTVVPLHVVLNGKHHDMRVLSDAMNGIHSALTRAKAYPSGESWQIVDIENYSIPSVIGREDNNDWLMAGTLLVKIYWRGE